MKLIALFGAAALAASTLVAAAPAEAQRYGYDRGYGGRGWDRGWDRRDHRGWNGPGGWDRGYGYRGPGYGYGRGYGRSRVICRIARGYYGPVRRCVRVYR